MTGKKKPEKTERDPGASMDNLDRLFRDVVSVSNTTVRERMAEEKRTKGAPKRLKRSTRS
jgi:hypothetical protein